MSHTVSPSVNRRYGVVRVAQEWGVPRSTLYAVQARQARPAPSLRKRGPKTAYTDDALTVHIRGVLAASPFLGEGHRKVWARLRVQGIRPSKGRVLRLMRAAGLLAPHRATRVLGPKTHDGTITTANPDVMWGTDATSTWTVDEGQVTVFVAVDHCTLEGMGIHAAKVGTRFEALEPIRQGVRRTCGGFHAGLATGLTLRHDHGSQYMSGVFQEELAFLGIESSPAFVRAPEGNGIAERFIRTLKEQLLWVRPFHTVEELRQALHEWLTLYNEQWLIERHGHRSPAQVRRDFLAKQEAA